MLSDYDGSRANNFTIVKLFFALVVLAGHSFPITGHGYDPISRAMVPFAWVGSLAVSGFFAISGFLVTASFVQRGAFEFFTARVLRLYPAVIVYSLVAILIIGPLGSSVDLRTYFQANPWDNLWNVPLWTWKYNLPYGFADHTLPGSTNGSSWTLPAEMRCYLTVLVFGLVGMLKTKLRANAIFFVFLFATVDSYTHVPFFGQTAHYMIPLVFFITGAFFWINREWIPLNLPIAILAVVALFAATKDIPMFIPTYAVCFSYLTFYAVYRLPHVNLDRIGDISFGVYLYAWPIQQLVWRKEQSGMENAALAILIVIPVAYLSWKFVEQPALRLRTLFKPRLPLVRNDSSRSIRLVD
jgi:peptidoglycan/LPS O-acetylase OafA/YrhL